jgi:hypothetical protein
MGDLTNINYTYYQMKIILYLHEIGLFACFTTHQHNLGNMVPKKGKMILANLGYNKLKATTGVKTISSML